MCTVHQRSHLLFAERNPALPELRHVPKRVSCCDAATSDVVFLEREGEREGYKQKGGEGGGVCGGGCGQRLLVSSLALHPYHSRNKFSPNYLPPPYPSPPPSLTPPPSSVRFRGIQKWPDLGWGRGRSGILVGNMFLWCTVGRNERRY